MNAQQAIKKNIDGSSMVCMAYIEDLSDAELLRRPAPGCNHINWQLGHLIVAENQMVGQIAPGAVPPLPAGFAEKYTKEASTKDDAKSFCSKAELLAVHQAQRAATLAALEKLREDDLDKPSGIEWARRWLTLSPARECTG